MAKDAVVVTAVKCNGERIPLNEIKTWSVNRGYYRFDDGMGYLKSPVRDIEWHLTLQDGTTRSGTHSIRAARR